MNLSFKNVMNYSPDNEIVYTEIKNNIDRIMPFIGAGMSAFAYPCWENFLKASSDKLYDTQDKNKILNIMKLDYEAAADKLLELRGRVNFIADICNSFSESILDNCEEILFKQAVYLLPMLFSGPLLTTNYDKTIETIYNKHNKVIPCGRPSDSEMLRNKMFNKKLCLYKFHGDIDRPSEIVLGKKSYDDNYYIASELVNDLKIAISNAPLLFLGSSLSKDRTIEVLQKFIAKGMSHYAILDCSQRDIARKSRELGDIGIRTILYPSGEHSSVRIILEKLLHDVNYEEYSKLPYKESEATVSVEGSERFTYKSGIVQFYGREEEIKKLQTFLEDDRKHMQWWAITGNGGTGKSRLVFEFRNVAASMHWDVIEINSINKFQLPYIGTRNLLITIDYAQSFVHKIGEWLNELKTINTSNKIKILFIEREGTNIYDASWAMQIKDDVNPYDYFINICYDAQNFLRLNKLGAIDILCIMNDYAIAHDVDLSEDDFLVMLSQLKVVDPESLRPLYALMIADVWINDKSIALNMKKYEILNYIVDREKKRYEKMLDIISTDWCFKNNFLFFKALATAFSNLSIDTIINKYTLKWNQFRSYSKKYKSIIEMFFSNGLIIANEMGHYFLPSMQPDIMGEYFFLTYLQRLQEDEDTLHFAKELIDFIWEDPIIAINFFNRLINDHSVIMNENDFIRINLLLPLRHNTIDWKLLIIYYSSICSVCDGRFKRAAIHFLHKCYIINVDKDKERSAVYYAKGLSNYAKETDIKKRREIVIILSLLWHKYTNNREICLCLTTVATHLYFDSKVNKLENHLLINECLYSFNTEDMINLRAQYIYINYHPIYSIQNIKNDIIKNPENEFIIQIYLLTIRRILKIDPKKLDRRIDALILEIKEMYIITHNINILILYSLILFEKVSKEINDYHKSKNCINMSNIKKIINKLRSLVKYNPQAFMDIYNFSLYTTLKKITENIDLIDEHIKFIVENSNNYELWLHLFMYLEECDPEDVECFIRIIDNLEVFFIDINESKEEKGSILKSVCEMIRSLTIRFGFKLYGAKNFDDTFHAFLIANKWGDRFGGINAAYMLRRKEIRNNKFNIHQLLKEGIENNETVALINLALYDSIDLRKWNQSDKYIASINKTDGTGWEWWLNLYQQGDVEGSLVLCWLRRHNIIELSEVEINNMKNKIKFAYRQCPDWIFEKNLVTEEYDER